MKIIGLTGFAKSGKSTSAEVLKEMGGQEVAFAKHLKDVCSIAFGVPRDHFDDQNFKEKPFRNNYCITLGHIYQILGYFEISDRFIPATILKHINIPLKSPRHIAQYVGTEILRDIDTDIHVNMALKLSANSKAKFLICSDVRFENEMKAVQDREGIVLGIYRKEAEPKNLKDLHSSEIEIPELIKKSNDIIINDGSIWELKKSVELAVGKYLNEKA